MAGLLQGFKFPDFYSIKVLSAYPLNLIVQLCIKMMSLYKTLLRKPKKEQKNFPDAGREY